MPNPGKVVLCEGCGQQIAIPPGYENVQGKCRSCGGVVNRQPAAAPAQAAASHAAPQVLAAPQAGIPSGIEGITLPDLGLDQPPVGLAGAGVLNDPLNLNMSGFGTPSHSLDGAPSGAIGSMSGAAALGLESQPATIAYPGGKKKDEVKEPFKDKVKSIAYAGFVWGIIASFGAAAIVSGVTAVMVWGFGMQFAAIGSSWDCLFFFGFGAAVLGLAMGAVLGIIRTREMQAPGGAITGLVIGLLISPYEKLAENMMVGASEVPVYYFAFATGAAMAVFGTFIGTFFTPND